MRFQSRFMSMTVHPLLLAGWEEQQVTAVDIQFPGHFPGKVVLLLLVREVRTAADCCQRGQPLQSKDDSWIMTVGKVCLCQGISALQAFSNRKAPFIARQ